MKKIPLNRGYVAIVDDEDYDRLSQYRWFVTINPSGNKYAKRRHTINGVTKHFRMHREVLGLSHPPPYVDHVNWNGLDNRKQNLRICTQSQNCQHMRPRSNGSSIYKGVRKHGNRQSWSSEIYIKGERIYLGYFLNERDAARAYDGAAKKHFGEFAVLNFPIQIKE